MRRVGVLGLVVVAFVATLPTARAAREGLERNGSVYAQVRDDEVVLGNAGVERRWSRSPFVTTELVDKRGQNRDWAAEPHPDFSLRVGAVDVGSDDFTVADVAVEQIKRGLRLTFSLTGPLGLKADRVVEAYNGVQGFRSQTVLRPTTPLVLSEYSLDQASVGVLAPTIHAFRAGADWREPDWAGPQLTIGDPHAGTWRSSSSAAAGESLAGPAQWISMGDGDSGVFMVMERNDQPSSRASYDGDVASLRVEYPRDVITLGPFEEQAHVENSNGGVGRSRVLQPGQTLALEPSFVGFARGDGDEAWQWHKYLVGRRLVPYERAVTFNSNGTDADVISTGAKDDMNIATVREVAPIARRLGVETFILDDGWQARSGDWYPDSPQYPEPRPTWGPRFPDATFAAVREAIAPMKLGLWMSPMHFHPSSETYKAHPEWACHPVGDGTALYNTVDAESGSNEAGIGIWSPAAIPHIESRIRDAIENWGVVYFKFDFLMWVDCAGEGDLYDYREAFMAMVDRLRASHPSVTFQIDETNDYRLFPFESVTRGPSWFQNGSPTPDRLLHNLWNLSPYVPASSLGQHALGGQAYKSYPVPTLMAVSLLSHITYFSDLRSFPSSVVNEAAPWMEFYKSHRAFFTDGVVYPLLADPIEKGWTALQSWDADAGRGAVLAFRQDGDAPSATVALKKVPLGRTFDLIEAPTGAVVGTVTSADLVRGLRIDLPEKRTAKVLLMVPRT